MKTKTKIVTLVEITVVLCSMLLMAIPAIAAEQTTQKVSASANTITTASKDDFVLGVYGNANEDDTIDMRDLTYVKLIFFGKKPETELADAKYDGKINPLDFIQIKLIIVGKEKEITILDAADRIVTVKKPIKRIVIGGLQAAEGIRILRAEDKMVGVGSLVIDKKVFYPELSKLPSIGSQFKPDFEKIVELKPDIVIWPSYFVPELAEMLEPAGITVVRLDIYKTATIIENIRKMGYILEREHEAEEFIDWYSGYMNGIKSRTEGLSEDEKPRVYFEFRDYSTCTRDYIPDTMITIAGGRNIAADLGDPDKSITVDAEWVVQQNPDIIVTSGGTGSGYGVDDPTGLRDAREAILNRPELATVTAVKDDSVYVLPWAELVVTARSLIGTAYMAKWFHPDLFEDMDPQAMHQEYLDRFQHLDYDLDEHGVFVYPPLES